MGKNIKDIKDKNVLKKTNGKKIKKNKSIKIDNNVLIEFSEHLKIRETQYIKISKTKKKKHHKRKNKNSTTTSSNLFDDNQGIPFIKRKYHRQDRSETLEHNYHVPNFQPQQISCKETNDNNSNFQQVQFQNTSTTLVDNSEKEFDRVKFIPNCYLEDIPYGEFDIIIF